MIGLTADSDGMEAVLARLRAEDALGQLVERRGRMAELAMEAGDVKLDWVDQTAWSLAHPETLSRVEGVVDGLRRSGIRHVIWAGMGGSVQCVRSLVGLGVFEGGGIAVHPLDSTDPSALNRLLGDLTRGAGGDAGTAEGLAGVLRQTVMIGVAMGMTSEEPITHLEWFDALLREYAVPEPSSHVLVVALPDSFLDQFAQRTGARQLPIQPDGASHTPGRMSAPSTHVFLLPAALALAPGELRQVLERCQAEFQLAPGLEPARRAKLVEEDPFVRLAAWLHLQIEAGRDMLLLDLSQGERALGPWVEQIIEESLGKGGRGLLAFPDQDLASADAWPDRFSVLRIGAGSGLPLPGRPLAELELAGGPVVDRLAEVARFFAGWSLTVAVLGYLQGITFAGQPAVEAYKRYARELRDQPGPLSSPVEGLVHGPDGRLSLAISTLETVDVGLLPAVLAGMESLGGGAAAALAATIVHLREHGRLGYLDVTLNAEPVGPLWDAIEAGARQLGNHVLKRPVKVRSGPRDYHSTEQSETDGPPDLLSLRFLVRHTEPVSAGSYSSRFLHAQALGTVAAMRDAGRPVLLATLESREDVAAVRDLFKAAVRLVP